MTLEAGSSVAGNRANRPATRTAAGGIFTDGGAVNLDPGSSVTGNTPDNCEPPIGTGT